MEPALATQLGMTFGLPRIPRSTLSRPRLDGLFDGLLAVNDVIVVRGPAGAGKTVALADWATSRAGDWRHVWITLDPPCVGRAAFWREFIIRAAAGAEVRPEKIVDSCLDALTAGVDPRAVLPHLLRHLPRCLLVLDRFEGATDDLVEDLLWALRTNEHLHVIISTRRKGQFESPRTALELDVAVVAPTELDFTEAETAALLERRGLPLDAGQLRAASGGHPRVTRAAVAAIERHGPLSPDLAVKTAVAGLFDYDTVKAEVGERMMKSLIRTAVPEALTVDLATILSGHDGAALLQQFEDNGWGGWSSGAAVPRFHFAAAYQAALRGYAKNLDPREMDDVLRKVIAHDLIGGDFLSALRNAVHIDDLDLASTIACTHHMVLLMYHAEDVKQILDQVPLPRMRKHPVLIMALALCYNSIAAGQRRAMELFVLAAGFSCLYRKAMGTEQRLWMLVLESVALRFSGQHELAARQAAKALASFEEAPAFLQDDLRALEPTLYTQSGIAFFHAQDFDRAIAVLNHGIEASQRAALVAEELLASGLLALVLSTAGYANECKALLTKLKEAQWPPGMESEYWATAYRIACVHEAVGRQDLDDAGRYLALISDEMRASEFWPHLLAATVTTELMAGRRMGILTLEARIKAASKAPLGSSGANLLDRLRAAVHLVAGHPEQAEKLLAKHRNPTASVTTMLGFAALNRSDAHRALSVLSKVPENAGPWIESHTLMGRAVAHFRLGQSEAARDSAGAAVALMQSHGLDATLLLLPPEDLEILNGLLRSADPALPVRKGLAPPATTATALTQREVLVLRAIVEHGSSPAVAAALGVSVNTVKAQTRSIYKKLGVSSRADAIRKARSCGVLD